MYFQQCIAWSTPVSESQKQKISFEALTCYGHLKPPSHRDLVITDISEVFECPIPERVCKHTAANHVRQFREEGILKLGTFREFRESDDPANQDPTEGQLSVWVEQSDYSYHDVGGADDRFRIFCTSLNRDKTRETSGYGDSRYMIEDLEGFLRAIANQAGIVPIAMTQCLYRNSRVLKIQDPQTRGIPNPLNGPTAIQKYAQIGLSFIKPHSHAEHAEFRFLWHDQAGRVPPNGIIRCPDAREFCRFS